MITSTARPNTTAMAIAMANVVASNAPEVRRSGWIMARLLMCDMAL
jgi:hypothetical protein